MKSLSGLIMTIFLAIISAQAQEACVTVRVTDESGEVVAGAAVDAGFSTWIQPGWGWGGGAPNIVRGFSDKSGLCLMKGKGNGGEVGIAAEKQGYYNSSGYSMDFTNLTGVIRKKWQPWNPTINVMLRRIGNPIPMYVRKIKLAVPDEGIPVGFDLLKADWVAPCGKGETSDLFFQLDREIGDDYSSYDATLIVSFPNEGDGIQAVPVPQRGCSALRLPAAAPEGGYASKLVRRMSQDPDGPAYCDLRADQNYFFRVRAKKDANGRIASALYGKIYGDFDRDFLDGDIGFTYYLNPAVNDRNTEFDPKRNLFGELTDAEEVREP